MTGVAPGARVKPGTRLAGRYLLTERHPEWESEEPTEWWARDEVLCRLVWLRLLPSTGPFPAAVLDGARAAAGLADPRFTRVLDVGNSDGLRFLVSEAIAAPALSDLLAEGPLPPSEAVGIVTQVADALAAAHARGLAHGRLGPHEVFLDDASIKIVGLERASMVQHPAVPPAMGADFLARAAADVRACGSLLYAALTGRWPGPGACRLPAAPRCGGTICRPGQIRAGVPARLDKLVCALLGLPRGGKPASAQPCAAELVSALRSLGQQLARESSPARDPRALPSSRRRRAREVVAAPARGSVRSARAARAAGVAAASVLLVGLLLAAGQLSLILLADPPSRPPAPAARSRATTASQPVIPVQRVQAIGPDSPRGVTGFRPGGDPALAIDADPATAWRSAVYPSRAPTQRPGDAVGLLLDLGAPRTVATVNLVLLGRPSDVQLRGGLRPPADRAIYPLIRRVESVGPRITLVPDTPLSVRYLVIELVGLPPVTESPGLFRGGIAEVAVRG